MIFIGAISHNLFQKRKHNKSCGLLISLATGLIEKYTILEIAKPPQVTTTMMVQLGFYPPTSHTISNALEKVRQDFFATTQEAQNVLKTVHFQTSALTHASVLKVQTTTVPICVTLHCCLRLAKNNSINVPGNVWSTKSEKSAETEFWLCPDTMDFSNFIVGFILEKNIFVQKKTCIRYEIHKFDNQLIQGSFDIADQHKFFFSKIVALNPVHAP